MSGFGAQHKRFYTDDMVRIQLIPNILPSNILWFHQKELFYKICGYSKEISAYQTNGKCVGTELRFTTSELIELTEDYNHN